MRVYLAQHGEAASKDLDPERKLTEKGIEDVGKVAEFLKPLGINCSTIQHSGKARAAETAQILAPSLGGADLVSGRDGINPLDPVAPIADELNSAKDDTALVGHMPFMGKLASLLAAGDESLAVAAYTPGTVVCVEKDDAGKWHIAWMFNPLLFV